MEPQTEEAILTILKEISVTNRKIERSTLVYHDLRISGDDAGDLIERISREFGTSFKGLHFPDYFPDETEAMFFRIYLFFGGRSKKPLTVGHLMEVVERREWFDP
jgi:hypothetical protein